MMLAVIIAGVLLPVFWFGLWVPIMIAVARRTGLHTGVAVALSVLGPIGALIGVLSGRAHQGRSGFEA